MSAHTCHAFGCDAPVPPRMFMCRPHWFALPVSMRNAVLDAYTPGQERNFRKVSAAYLQAAREAQDFLRSVPVSEETPAWHDHDPWNDAPRVFDTPEAYLEHYPGPTSQWVHDLYGGDYWQWRKEHPR